MTNRVFVFDMNKKVSDQMRLTTKFVAIASAGVLGLGLTACGAGDTESQSGKTRIGVTVYDMSSFITAGKEGMDAVREGQQHRAAVELRQR